MSEAEKQASLASRWCKEIDEALKREKNYRTKAAKIVALYEGEKECEYQYNILYSNTETLAPALYNSTPRPVVDRRFKDEDPLGKLAARVSQRTLEYLVDDGLSEYSTFDELMAQAVLEGLVPGRGVTRFKYDAQVKPVPAPASEATEDDTTPEPQGGEAVYGEVVCGEEVPWDRFLHGYAKKWKDVPWASYTHYMTRDELMQFGPVGALVPLSANSDDAEEDQRTEEQKGMENVKVAVVYEIWDKATRTVLFIAPAYKDRVLREVDDPLGLSGFFPSPKPLTFIPKISTLLPVPLYAQYQEQHKELNKITLRINKIIGALKVRGMYDSTVEGIDKVLTAEDNVLIPAENVAALQAMGPSALEKAIWLFPIEALVGVLQQLYLQRSQIKQVIFEITGIADIMRGSSVASETLGAQEIKNQWGTLRLKKAQKAVARYARDCLRIMNEIAVTKLSPQTLRGMTELKFPTEAEQQQAQIVVQQAEMMQQPVPPELQEAASAPTWEAILALLRDDKQRSYRIDIETNSTVDAEATEDKENIAELMNALAQFLNGVQPLVDAGALPFEAAQSMMLAIVRRFRFGPELEDSLKMLKPPEPKADPAVEKAKAQMEIDQQKAQLDMQAQQLELQMKQQEMELRKVEMQMEIAFKQAEHQMKMQELDRKAQAGVLQHDLKLSQMKAQAAMPKPKPAAARQ